MKKDELIITFILAVILLCGSTYQFYHMGGKDAEVIFVSGESTPFDALEPISTPIIPPENTMQPVSSPTKIPMAYPQNQSQVLSPQQTAVLQWLNRASAGDFQNISGIGERTAANIMAYRQQHNGFRSIAELNQVSGIGEKRVKDIVDTILHILNRRNITSITPAPNKPNNQTIPSPQKNISLNQATIEQLQAVSGIGPHLANLIVDERAKLRHGFQHWNQINNISGVGEKKLELLQQHFTLP